MAEGTKKATPRPWYVGVMNDCNFIIDKPPRPSSDDVNHNADVSVIAKIGATLEDEANARLIVRAVNSFDALVSALERCVSIRETQRKRESEEFHIPAHTFMAMWDEADTEAQAALALARP